MSTDTEWQYDVYTLLINKLNGREGFKAESNATRLIKGLKVWTYL